MDEYMKPDELLNKLISKHEKRGYIAIACDFDHTLYSDDTGQSYEMVRQLLRDLKASGQYIIIWTANIEIAFIRNFLFKHGIPFDGINCEPPYIKDEKTTRKIQFEACLDDTCGLKEVYDTLVKFLKHINHELD